MGDKNDTTAESSSVLFGVWTAFNGVAELIGKALADAPLNGDDFGFYSAVYDGQPITPNEIAEALGMPATTVSSYLNRLSDRGHISRRKNPADGRSTLIELTAPGTDALEETWKRFEPAQKAVEAALALPVAEVIGVLRELNVAVRTAVAARSQKPSR
jgi:DNA-binding MarR family transcriptional regulator